MGVIVSIFILDLQQIRQRYSANLYPGFLTEK